MYIEERGYINIYIYREREIDREKWLGDRSIDREREIGGKGERLGEREREG
jgi:hypothetical protein